jgi:hypothetical protein
LAAADARLAGIDALTGIVRNCDCAECRLQFLREPKRYLAWGRRDRIADARFSMVKKGVCGGWVSCERNQ